VATLVLAVPCLVAPNAANSNLFLFVAIVASVQPVEIFMP